MSALNGYQLGKYILPGAEPPSKFLETKPGTQIDSKEPPAINPEYEIWIAKDQQVLNYLLSNMSKEILGQVNHEVTASAAWATTEGLFSSHSRARVIATRMALATASKGTSSISDYFGKMKHLADEMASAGKKLEDEELVSFILTGLDRDYDPVVTAVTARVEPITVTELYTQLVSHEQRIEIRDGGSNQSSANIAAKWSRNSGSNTGSHQNRNGGSGGGGRGGGGRGGFGRGQRGGRGGPNNQRRQSFQPGVYCQL